MSKLSKKEKAIYKYAYKKGAQANKEKVQALLGSIATIGIYVGVFAIWFVR